MFNHIKKEIKWAGRTLTIETGKVARQANGAVVITYGQTSLLCTVVGKTDMDPDVDFFPLTVHYQERSYAVGKIPGGFFKREGRATEKETLTSRLIDRPIRPLFPEAFKNETQIICTLLSHDTENDPEAIAIIGASAALMISGLPFLGPLAAAKIGYISQEFVLNPTIKEVKNSALELSIAGTKEGVLMVESEAKELSEDIMLKAIDFGHAHLQPILELLEDLKKECGKTPWEVTENSHHKDIWEKIEKNYFSKLEEAYQLTQKQERSTTLKEIRSAIAAFLKESDATYSDALIKSVTKSVEQKIVRDQLLHQKKRIDGRGVEDIRPIAAEVGLLKRSHGSALFTRGETQVIASATLGTGQDEQIIDALEGEYKESFMLHYNFPPYSVGEAGRIAGPGRREIGHGKLAWRALRPVLPEKTDFPYTLRLVSEVTESNGSSSMATVCGCSLALMDAGVPIKKSVAGIAMGLVKEKEDYVVISDILGDEDALGDMDFKVAGTKEGITALQMDIKITSITSKIMQTALTQAKAGRLHILEEMKQGIEETRSSVHHHAPRMTTLKIAKDKIRDVIGSGGSVIRHIVEITGAKIDIEDDGLVRIAAPDADASVKAIEYIKNIVVEPQIGVKYEGKVAKISEYGLIVNFLGARSGLVHFSELPEELKHTYNQKFKEGDTVQIRIINFDRGRPRLSMKIENTEKNKKNKKDDDHQ